MLNCANLFTVVDSFTTQNVIIVTTLNRLFKIEFERGDCKRARKFHPKTVKSIIKLIILLNMISLNLILGAPR